MQIGKTKLDKTQVEKVAWGFGWREQIEETVEKEREDARGRVISTSEVVMVDNPISREEYIEQQVILFIQKVYRDQKEHEIVDDLNLGEK